MIAVALSLLAAEACSTTSRLGEGEFALRSNSIEVPGTDVAQSSLMPYLKQQSPSFSIFGGETVVFRPSLVELSEENLREHMSYLGYYGSDVETSVDTSRRKVSVHYLVHPGKRFRIKDIIYDVPGGEFAEDFYSDTLNVTVRRGDYLSEESLEAESERSAAYFRSIGYYGFSKYHYFFEADTLSAPGEAILVMSVRNYTRNESPTADNPPLHKSTIGDVTITHSDNIKFRERVLKGLNTVRPGQLYNEQEISTTYNRMSALRVFNSVGVVLSESDSSHVRCDINLSESKLQGVKLDLEASTNSSGLVGISPQITYTHKNIFHGGEWLNLGFLGNFQFKPGSDTRSDEFGVSAGVSFPKFLGLPYRFFTGPSVPRTEINAAFSYQDRPEYTRSIFSTSFGYTGTYAGKWQYQLYPLQLNLVRLTHLDSDFYKTLESNPFMRYSYQDHFDAGVGGTIFYQASSSWYGRFMFDLSGNVLSLLDANWKRNSDGKALIFGAPYTQYVRGEWTLARNWALGMSGSRTLAARVVAGAGYAYGNSTALPFEKQLYVGGANSMRGWQARALGPGGASPNATFAIPSQTGDLRLETNLEYRFDLVWKLEGALFADAGNVWTLMEDSGAGRFDKDFYKSIAADWGLGVRCNLNFLVIRVDLGMQLRDPVGDGAWYGPEAWLKKGHYALHFGVGYPF